MIKKNNLLSFVFILGFLYLGQGCDIQVKVESAGYKHGNYTDILVNNIPVFYDSFRGFNILVLDHKTFAKVDQQNFDTYGVCSSLNKMLDFLEKIENNQYVLIGVRDEANKCLQKNKDEKKLREQFQDAFESLGLNIDIFEEIKYGGSFSAIGQKKNAGLKYQNAQQKVNYFGQKVVVEQCLQEKCEYGHIKIGSMCQTDEWSQRCYDQISQLDQIETRWEIDGEDYQRNYNNIFSVVYKDMIFDEDCVEQHIKIGEYHVLDYQIVQEGKNTVVQFERKKNQLQALGCLYTSSNESSGFRCQLKVDVFFAGAEQMNYDQKIEHMVKRKVDSHAIENLYNKEKKREAQEQKQQEQDQKLLRTQQKRDKLNHYEDQNISVAMMIHIVIGVGLLAGIVAYSCRRYLFKQQLSQNNQQEQNQFTSIPQQ